MTEMIEMTKMTKWQKWQRAILETWHQWYTTYLSDNWEQQSDHSYPVRCICTCILVFVSALCFCFWGNNNVFDIFLLRKWNLPFYGSKSKRHFEICLAGSISIAQEGKLKFLLSQTMIIDQLSGRGWGLIFFLLQQWQNEQNRQNQQNHQSQQYQQKKVRKLQSHRCYTHLWRISKPS